jgi:hypothetical protein
MIPESYHVHLSEKLTRSNYLLTILLIQVVQSIKEVTLENQQFVLTPVFAALSDYRLLVLGDREFCSVTFANCLREQKVDFCFRLKKNVCIKTESELWAELKMLGLEPGNSFFNREVTIRKTAPIAGFNLAGKWLGKYRNIITKEPWYILTSLADLPAAVNAYAKRFGIEERRALVGFPDGLARQDRCSETLRVEAIT